MPRDALDLRCRLTRIWVRLALTSGAPRAHMPPDDQPPKSSAELPLLDRLREIPRRGGKLSERLRDRDDAHANAGTTERLNTVSVTSADDIRRVRRMFLAG